MVIGGVVVSVYTHETSMLRVLDLKIMAVARIAPKPVIAATGQIYEAEKKRKRETSELQVSRPSYCNDAVRVRT